LFACSLRALRQHGVVLVGLLTILALAPSPALADDGLAVGSTGVASGEALRAAPGFDAPVATEVAAGTEVTIADGPLTAADGSLWYQVDVWGQIGYLPTYAVSAGAAAPVADGSATDPVTTDTTTDPALEQPAPAAPVAPAPPIGTVYVVGTDGDGAACRAEASYESAVLATLPEGSAAEATGGAVGEWQPVNCGGSVGYVNAAYVSWDPNAVGTATTEPVDEWATDAGTAAEPAAAEPAAAESGRERRGGGGGSGQAVADFAMQYVGYPYTYAGAGPDAFDCTGFTMYVVGQTLGMDISHDAATQYGMGTPVDRGSLQPGDLVFFQNTFQPGLSHAGIYVGGGQFVHAENESTGVKVSDLNSSYYTEHWYGAVRLV
jgi:cell wall-associated NlpC family hydrolase